MERCTCALVKLLRYLNKKMFNTIVIKYLFFSCCFLDERWGSRANIEFDWMLLVFCTSVDLTEFLKTIVSTSFCFFWIWSHWHGYCYSLVCEKCHINVHSRPNRILLDIKRQKYRYVRHIIGLIEISFPNITFPCHRQLMDWCHQEQRHLTCGASRHSNLNTHSTLNTF